MIRKDREGFCKKQYAGAETPAFPFMFLPFATYSPSHFKQVLEYFA